MQTKFDHVATLTRIDHVTPQLFVIECETAEPVPFIAGQYMSIVNPEGHASPFSIASSPATPTKFEFGIGLTGGPITSMLVKMSPGEKILLRGPFGKFILQGEQKVCLLAGGVGSTPFVCMLRAVRDLKQPVDLVLCYSGKTREQLLWHDELMQAMHDNPNIRTVFTLTEEKPEGWQHRLGRIDQTLLRLEVQDYLERSFYCCGPPPFIAAMRKLVTEMGVPEERFYEEKW